MNDFGWNDHVTGEVLDEPLVLPEDIERAIAHAKDVARWWNDHARRVGLPILLNPDKVIRRLENMDFADYTAFFHRSDDSGVLHETQIITVINILMAALNNPDKSGLVLGALQAGKTLTAIALLWLGPVSYLLTGRKIKPLYLITAQTSHEDQAAIKLARFLDWYGDIELRRSRNLRCSLNSYNSMVKIHPMFNNLPTLKIYRNVVLAGFEQGDFVVDRTGFIQRRVHGQAIGRIAEICRKANEMSIEVVLILDEAQYGAGDQDVPDTKTGRNRRKCVLRQILDAIAYQCRGLQARYIGISATPFELFDVSTGQLPHVWRVHLSLSKDYVGFNFFGGDLICDGVEIKVPDIHSFEKFGADIGNPLFTDGHFDASIWAMQHRISMRSGDIERRFRAWAKRNYYTGDYDEYVVEFETALHDAIMHLAESEDKPVGICIRLCNNNEITSEGIKALSFDPDRIEVLEFFTQIGKNGRVQQAGSVKRFLQEQRKRTDLPFVMFVTSKARMGDAFPAKVKYFIECSFRATTLNSLLQGLLGRACGYSKETTVILSSENDIIINNWMATQGGHVYPTSRYTVPVKLRRGPKTNMLKLTTDMTDPVVQEYFRRVKRDVIDPMLEQNCATLKTSVRMPRGTTRTGPLLKIADDLGLFDHLEANQNTLFPNLRGVSFKIARVNGPKVMGRDKTGKPQVQRYYVDPNKPGWCAFTFRHSASARGGRAGRGIHGEDTTRDSQTDRARVDGRLEPQINVEKYDAKTGVAFDDRKDLNGVKIAPKRRRAGLWRSHMITLPLVSAVQEVVVGEAAYPVGHSPFSDHLTPEERADRDDEIVRAKRRRR